MPNDLSLRDTLSHLPALPERLEARIKLRWNSAFDRPIAAEHSLSLDERREAWRIVKAQLAPCGHRFAAAQITPLYAAMKAKRRDGFDVQVVAKSVPEALADLPADLVEAACKEWFKTREWQPVPAELIAMMEPELSRRRVMLKALERAAGEPERKAPPPRADARSIDEILTKHGYTPVKPGVSA